MNYDPDFEMIEDHCSKANHYQARTPERVATDESQLTPYLCIVFMTDFDRVKRLKLSEHR